MFLFVLGLILAGCGAILLLAPSLARSRALGLFLGVCLIAAAVSAVGFSTAIYVKDDEGGIIIRKFGPDLPTNRVIAANGEKGPQAMLLGPGWHFGYYPWIYDLVPVPTVTISQGQVGVINALDGKPLPPGEVFAPEWSNSEELLDGMKFLANATGYRGPQLTVLTPGRYRYNPRLFTIDMKPALSVAVGEVVVVKANAGRIHVPTEGGKVEIVNGVPLVPRGFRGIWNEPLTPNAYYLHPDAFAVTRISTTNRVYTYQHQKWAIKVRSKDGFTFPVDVRLACSVSATDAPYLVALLGDPDRTQKNEQEDEEALQTLEAQVILPQIRAIFRNVAEGMNALQFVNSRSQVESQASQRMKDELLKFRITSEGVFIGNIDLDASDAGKALIATQTDREVAVNQQKTFAEKQAAEEARARFVLAQEEADQQRKLAVAKYQVLVREQEAKAREAEANGEARYITITSDAKKAAYTGLAQAIGAAGVVQIELLKAVADGKVNITPQIMVTGGGSALDALAGTLLGNSLKPPADGK